MGLALRVETERREASETTPEMSAVDSERREELLLGVNNLGENDRMVISCRYFLELSEEETAITLGCARGTVKSRLSRAVAKLRASMTKEQDAG